MPWYGWVIVGVGVVGLAVVGLLASIPIRFYRGFISRHALTRLPDASTVSTGVTIRCRARVSPAKVALLDPWLAGRAAALRGLATSLQHGAAEPAVVVSTAPLCVACFSDDFDAVLVLRFDESFKPPKRLALGDRLLCVTTFFWAMVRPTIRPVAPDIVPGPRYSDWFDNFAPFIVDFISDDIDEVERCKALIPDEQWERAFELGYERLQSPIPPRDGRPSLCHRPARAWTWLWRLTRAMSQEDAKPMPGNGVWGTPPRSRAMGRVEQ